jgi:hypothetical protein
MDRGARCCYNQAAMTGSARGFVAGELQVIFGAGPLGLAVMRAQHRARNQVRMVIWSGRATVPEGVEVMAADAGDHTARLADGGG